MGSFETLYLQCFVCLLIHCLSMKYIGYLWNPFLQIIYVMTESHRMVNWLAYVCIYHALVCSVHLDLSNDHYQFFTQRKTSLSFFFISFIEQKLSVRLLKYSWFLEEKKKKKVKEKGALWRGCLLFPNKNNPMSTKDWF